MTGPLRPLVVKVSGGELDSPAFLAGLGRALAELPLPGVLVHGGGRAVGEVQRKLGSEPRFVEGRRVTDEETLAVVEMVLRGSTNLRLVSALEQEGVRAVGLSGVDGGMVRVRPVAGLGRVGEVLRVETGLLRALLAEGYLPVLSPVCLGEDGLTYNVNADEVAQAVATALEAQGLAYVSLVPGVLKDGRVLSRLDGEDVEALLAEGTVRDGMVPKVRAALAAARAGLRVGILDLQGLSAWVRGETVGTTLVAPGGTWPS